MRPRELKALLAKTIPAGRPVLVVGPPGIGKSNIVAEAAAAAGADLIVSHPVVSDPTDYKGLPGIVEGQAEFLPFGDLRALMGATKPTVAFLDDLGQAPPVVQAAAMQLLLNRAVNGHRISDHVCFVAASNRRQDKAGVTGVLEPVKSRFTTIVNLEADLADWCAWAIDHAMPPELIAFVRFKPALLHDFHPTSDLVNSACPRTVANVGELLKLGISDFDVLTGAAGEGFATEFCAFVQVWRQLPSPDAVLMDPENADVPTEPATLYAICQALASRASQQNAGRIARYARRLPLEYAALMIRDAHRRDRLVAADPEIIRWFSEHDDELT